MCWKCLESVIVAVVVVLLVKIKAQVDNRISIAYKFVLPEGAEGMG